MVRREVQRRTPRAQLEWLPCFIKEETGTKNDQMLSPRPPRCLMAKL